ncbi:MAG: glucosyl-3-phosphoglycerate synthase [Chloroflexota bacterium]
MTHFAWEEVCAHIEENGIDLLLLSYPCSLANLDLTAAEILSHPPCDIALFRGPLLKKPHNIIVPLRGGPHSERSLDIALGLSQASKAKISSLRLDSVATETTQSCQDFEAIHTILDQIPNIEQTRATQNNQAEAIIESSIENDLIILGTLKRPTAATDSFGAITDFILENAKCGVIAVKTRIRDTQQNPKQAATMHKVDRWFAEKTFHADEFKNIEQLVRLKQEQNLTLSVALPTLNEAETIGNILQQIQELLIQKYPLIDELVVIDSNSTDETPDIVKSFGVPLYVHQDLLSRYGERCGKGEALWKSLYVTSGDIVLWCDTDIKNFDPRFIYGLAGPLLQDPSIQFVKGFYQRPLKVNGKLQSGGGRVTELTARPLLNMFYPELGGIIQPLAGEYGGRRELLESVTFTSGYGVETSLLIDALENVGLDGLAQVDLIKRVHHNQTLESLGKMAFAVSQTVFQRLEQKDDVNSFDQISKVLRRLRQNENGTQLEFEPLAEQARPPMQSIPEYRNRYQNGEMPFTGVKKENLMYGSLEDPDEIFLVPGKYVSRS